MTFQVDFLLKYLPFVAFNLLSNLKIDFLSLDGIKVFPIFVGLKIWWPLSANTFPISLLKYPRILLLLFFDRILLIAERKRFSSSLGLKHFPGLGCLSEFFRRKQLFI